MAQPTTIEPFPFSLARELDAYIQTHQNKTMFTDKKRGEYRYWLLNQERRVQGGSTEAQQQRNIKHDAIRKYD